MPPTDTPAPTDTPPPPTAIALVMEATVGLEPQDIVAAGGYVWVAHPDGQLHILTPEGQPLTVVETVGGATSLATDGARVWVAHRSGAITQLDAGSGAITAQWALDCADCLVRGLHWDGTALWASNFAEATLHRLDVTSGASVSFPAGADSPTVITADRFGVHVLHQSLTGSVVLTRHDAASGAVTGQIEAGGAFATALLSDGEHLWLALREAENGALVRYHPATLAEEWRVEAAPINDLLRVGDSLFSADFTDNTVTERDPETGAVLEVFTAGTLPQALAYDNGLLWVVNRRAGTLTRYWVGP